MNENEFLSTLSNMLEPMQNDLKTVKTEFVAALQRVVSDHSQQFQRLSPNTLSPA